MDSANHRSTSLNPHAHSAAAYREHHHAIDSEGEESPASDIDHHDRNNVANQELRTPRQSPMSFAYREADTWMPENWARMGIPAIQSGYWHHPSEQSRGPEEEFDKLPNDTTRPKMDRASMGFAFDSQKAAASPRSQIQTLQLRSATVGLRGASRVHEPPWPSINTYEHSQQKAQTLGVGDTVRERQKINPGRNRVWELEEAMDDVRREEEAHACYQEGQRMMANGDLDQDGDDGGTCEWIWDPLHRAHRDEEQWSADTTDGCSYTSGGSEDDVWSPLPCTLQLPTNMFELEADSRHAWRLCRAQACEEAIEAHGALIVRNREDYVPYAPEP